MAISIVSNRGKTEHGVREYFLDTLEDVQNLPKTDEVGSIAIVISTGDIYLINSEHQWVKFE